MWERNKPLIEDIKGSMGKLKGIRAVIIFGSVARGKDKPDSDIDICVVIKEQNSPLKKAISNSFLEIEKKYDRNIQLIICNEQYKGMERQFLETILREGKVIIGDFPSVPIQKLELEPYAIIKYEMKKLSHSEKMRLTRLVYGKETKKVYKGKTYVSRKKGLIAELGGIRSGKSSILLPEKESWILEEQLSELGIKTKKICAWLQKI